MSGENQATAMAEAFGAFIGELAHFDSMLQVVLERLVIIQSELQDVDAEDIWEDVEAKRNEVREATLERMLEAAGTSEGE